MLFDVARLLLYPLVRWQAHQVRRRSALLPEAEGHREGVSGTGRVKLRVLIVGDSSAAGVGAQTQAQALSGRLGEALSQRLEGAVVWQVVARRSDATADSVHALQQMELRPADVMVTTVGLIDLVDQLPPERWLRSLDRLDRVAVRRAGVRHVVHCGLPPVQSYPLPDPLRWVLAEGQRRYNRALARWVRGRPDRSWLPIPFENELSADSVLMAGDGLHPGPAVYALWAEQLAQEISTSIVPHLPDTTPTRSMPGPRLSRRSR